MTPSPPVAIHVRDRNWAADSISLAPGADWRRLKLDAPLPELRAACRGQPAPAAAVIEGAGGPALAVAREIHACTPLTQIVFLAAAPAGAAQTSLRPFVLRGVPWILLQRDDPRLPSRISEQIEIGERRRRHRTAINAVNARLDAATGEDRRRLSMVANSERFLAAFVQVSPDAIVTLSPAGDILGWNRAAAEIWELPAPAALGRPFEHLLDAAFRARFRASVEQVRRSSQPARQELAAMKNSGLTVPIETTVAKVTDESGATIAYLTIARDITERRRSQQELEQARDRAIAASRAKDDFLASLSHELRTPLTPVLLLASEATDNPRLPAEIRADFSLIHRNIELEARLIDDLLDLTRITRDTLPLKRQPTDAHAILAEAIQTVRPELEAKHLRLSVELHAGASMINADPLRVQQVFWNVLRNAGKFTEPRGHVQVRTCNDAGGAVLRVVVSDTGIGMTEEEIRHVFEMFSQGEHAHRGAHRYGGLGLGLAIARRLAEMHGGNIRAASAGRGRGSEFTIELPLATEGRAPQTGCSTTPNDPPPG